MSVSTILILYTSTCITAAQPLVNTSAQIPRPLAAGVVVTHVLLLQHLLEENALLVVFPLWKTMLKSYLLVQTLQSLNNLVFDPLYLDPTLPSENTWSAAIGFFSTQCWSGCKANWRWRAIGTDREAKNTPGPHDTVPSRSKMIFKHLLILGSCFVVLDLMSSMPQPDPHVAMAVEKESILGRFCDISTDELSFRAAATMGFWFGTFLGVNALYSCLAVVSMAIFKSDPAVWRPAFGSVREAYSIRRFWDVFWHQMLRNPLAGPVHYLARLLGLPSKSLPTRYLKLYAIFLLSGIFHLVADRSLGVSTEESGSLWFFQINAVAIMVEDAWQELCRRSKILDRWLRAQYLGYLWVVLFLVAVTPQWSYPQARVGGQMVLLPLGLAEKPQQKNA